MKIVALALLALWLLGWILTTQACSGRDEHWLRTAARLVLTWPLVWLAIR